ncbi:UDP-N-acetylmuramoyl-L-alanyl-D-glutamate--2,6-diaminopimelate ligase [Streptomyces aureocirculatus]|uniref:UDP-N-acetylmuramoyl-L-alanyl-D-glutamate--2, 6-diaminopimelate ligase n=1 Tax=Streptomyces aureocirculatus TaxID=67275 RepID=UPI00068D2150|nr:UDP-N-acetylmuramoyl-L-alanyl-D-glutamate--2,6-diaminopimelate ligase [Streptomyces aureocirculatus]
MHLSELLAGQVHHVLQGDPSRAPITAGVTFDVDRVWPGSLFIAVPGHREGGPDSVTAAFARGAVAALVEGEDARLGAMVWPADKCTVRVADTRQAAAVVASRYFGEPGRLMDMVAITGTNGKTSVSYMIESALRISAGARVGVIGTAGSRIGDELIPMPHSVLSTPESPDLQYLLGHMRDRATGTVVLEATSMALLTHRVNRTFIDVGVFTNLTQDHLDDHGTMANYRNAKLRLFRGLCQQAVVNADDPVGAEIGVTMPGAVTTYALDVPADYRATDLAVSASGTHFTLHHGGHAYPAAIPFPGRYSVANALASLATCHVLGHDLDTLIAALSHLPPVPGRFERFETPEGTSVIVDYAHSPDSLDKVLATIRSYTRGRVITVFGCGGDRDTTKRVAMGRIAGTHSDLCVLTSDNPRNEDPEAILDQITPGLVSTGTPFERFADRRDAIAFALSAAGPKDTVLIAGKGSEPYQTVREELLPFSDMATARELAQEQTAARCPGGRPAAAVRS